ncbi:MAG: hypothetical protein JO148_02935, partial [Acidimicrobiia bacterium]|nr:hypothetical protein [Acidimicrobiia bacterium]
VADIAGTTISQNHATLNGGGGDAESGASLTIGSSTISQNTAGNLGGGFRLLFNVGSVTISGSQILGNSATGQGGAVASDAPSATIGGSVISGNSAGQEGGGAYIGSGAMALKGDSIVSNAAGISGGGVFNNGTVTTAGSSISNNTPNNCMGC